MMLRRWLLGSRPLASWTQQADAVHSHVWTLSARLWSNGGSATRGERVAVELLEEDLDESFVKGWGKGGQKINKVRNCVLLKHIPTGLHVRCQETRSLDGNRKIARRLLLQKLDDLTNGDLSKRNLKISKLRKKKANRRNKSKQKYAAAQRGSESDDDESDSGSGEEDEEDDDEEDDDEENVAIVDFDVEEHKVRSKKK